MNTTARHLPAEHRVTGYRLFFLGFGNRRDNQNADGYGEQYSDVNKHLVRADVVENATDGGCDGG